MYWKSNLALMFLAYVGLLYVAYDFLNRRRLKWSGAWLLALLAAIGMRSAGSDVALAMGSLSGFLIDWLTPNNPRGLVLMAVLVLGPWAYFLRPLIRRGQGGTGGGARFGRGGARSQSGGPRRRATGR